MPAKNTGRGGRTSGGKSDTSIAQPAGARTTTVQIEMVEDARPMGHTVARAGDIVATIELAEGCSLPYLLDGLKFQILRVKKEPVDE